MFVGYPTFQHYSLARENKRLKKLISSLSSDSPHWESLAMKQLKEKMTAVAVTDYTLLITGESGSGKEYIARQIHRLSKRKNATCHALNCPAIPEQLLESELFGHVRGAFTGAERNREGFFMAANKGTLILDEIGEITLPIQAKLLKFLQDREVKPVGFSSSKTTDVRIIALTNQNLEEKIIDQSFRQDLYYRLNVLAITVPPPAGAAGRYPPPGQRISGENLRRNGYGPNGNRPPGHGLPYPTTLAGKYPGIAQLCPATNGIFQRSDH